MSPYRWRIVHGWKRVCEVWSAPSRMLPGRWLLFLLFCATGLSPSDEAFNKVVSSLSVALTAQTASAFLKQIRRETYVAHLPAHTHDSVKHALLSTPSEDSLFSEEVIQRSLGKLGMIPNFNFYVICPLRRVRKVRPPLLPLRPSVVVVLPVLDSLRLPLPEIPRISLVAISARLHLLPLAVVHRNALLSRLPRRRRIFASRSYVPCLLWYAAAWASIGDNGGTGVRSRWLWRF